MKRLTFFLLSSFLLVFIACDKPVHFDILIKNGTIHDGLGNSAFVGDIAINGDSIIQIGEIADNAQADQIIDASGYIVSPGFVDTHTHALADLTDSLKKSNLNFLLQGATTVVNGSDGNSVLDIGARLKHWEDNGIGTNAALMVGHRTIRQRVMSMRDVPPTEEELENMKTLVRRGMEDGALGFSTGLYYAPASFADTEEVIELTKVAAENGGMYDAHIRDESTYNIGLVAAIEENIEIAKATGIHVNISHIKCLGVDVWGKSQEVIDLIEAAQKEGLKITADQYPYRASGTHLDKALLSRWVFADLDDYTQKFDDPTLLPKLKADIQENMRRRGGAASLLIIRSEDKSIQGMNIEEIAKKWEVDSIETAIRIIKNGSAAVASFNMNDQDIQNFMKKDWVMTCSDGSTNHPRKFSTYPRKLKEYVLEKKTLSLEEMIRKSTSFPAQTYGIKNRGQLKEGYFADILIFKPEEIQDNATFEKPTELAAGMHWIVLNGQLVVKEGEYTGALAGKAIKR